jgi:glutamate-ammonia-ligase adenylyltransferase
VNVTPWPSLLAQCADPQRATQALDLLRSAPAASVPLDHWPEPAARLLLPVLAASPYLTNLLCQHPDWLDFCLNQETLLLHPSRLELQRPLNPLLTQAARSGDAGPALDALHAFRQKELLRIGLRDLNRLAPLPELVLELSLTADVFLQGLLEQVRLPLVDRFGEPWHQEPDGSWKRTPFCILGLGKLGGQELNYSSDVDLLFVYAEEGGTFRSPPRGRTATPSHPLSNHAFFKRLGEALIKEASARGPEGGGLRVDMRLRPEGQQGPLARSLPSYETYYAQWGQSWERMMLLKARGVAGDPALAGEFLEAVHAFRYPRSIGDSLLTEMAEMKARIEREVVGTQALDRNVKLGRGGIRDIEFLAQSLQVLHGGRLPFLQSPHTLVALPKLADYELLPKSETTQLSEAYCFLRDLEHRLQMEQLRQTHTLPDTPPALLRLARLMGYPKLIDFQRQLRTHTQRVRQSYQRLLGDAPLPVHSGLPADFSDTSTWRQLLANHQFRDPDQAVRLVRTLVEGPGIGLVSRRTRDLGRQALQRLLEFCPAPTASTASPTAHAEFALSDPDRVLARLDSYITSYGTRALLYELWTTRPNVFAHILKLFDRSEFLAELAIREPDLVDELEVGGHLARQKNTSLTLTDLRHGRTDPDQHLWLRRYFQTEFMRLGLRDILGTVDFIQASHELTALAEACVQYALEIVTRKARLRQPPFAIIALGKFGGAELTYGSDLDLIFVAPNTAKNLPRLQKLAAEVIDLLSTRTPQGSVFQLDTRLRPDGEKGLLVNHLRSHQDYYLLRAQLWEIQALTRARWVAGHAPTGEAFITLAHQLTRFHPPRNPIAAWTPDWRQAIHRMRLRIERERTPPGRDALAFKTGLGGLIDIEFLAQTLALAHGWFEPNTLASLSRARTTGALPTTDANALLLHCRNLRRMESVLRRWSFEGEAVLPDDPPAQYRVAVRCGYPDAASFLSDLAQWRSEIRRLYLLHQPGTPLSRRDSGK